MSHEPLGAEALAGIFFHREPDEEENLHPPIVTAVRISCSTPAGACRAAGVLKARGFDVSRAPDSLEVWVHTDALVALDEAIKALGEHA